MAGLRSRFGRAPAAVVASCALFLSGAGDPAAGSNPEVLGGGTVTQIGIVVRDIEKASRAYAEILGVDVPSWSLTDGADRAHTEFRGAPSEARAKLAFIPLKNVTLELIEPVGGPSTWREFLEKNGEGVHHIAFEIKGMDGAVAGFARGGLPLLQKGDYEGGRYAYVDGTARLAVILELLENF